MPEAPPREELRRQVPFQLVRAEDGGDGRTLEGYAAVFDSVTVIDSWEGRFEEVIERGAFRKTLSERVPVLQFEHGRHPLIGSIPLGAFRSLREDDKGLHVNARLTDNWLIQPVRDAISDGGVSGMSFRFSVVREEWRDKDGKKISSDAELAELLWAPGDRGPLRRHLKEVKVAELGPVVFPAYDSTTVGVRSRPLVDALADEETRKDFARAMFMQDAHDAEDAAPPPQGAPADPAEEDRTTGTPPTTDGHLSAPPTPADSRALLREEVRLLREHVRTIKKEDSRHGG